MAKKKNNVKDTLQIHSQAKVEFYEKYLIRYLRILCLAKPIKQINIYDVFCGMGIYEDGGKGSPIVAFDTIKKLYDENIQLGETKITLVVNDKSQERVNRVKDYIEKKNSNYCSVQYHNHDIKEMFDMVQQKVSKTHSNTRNLIFIDPYGYKDIKKEILYNLMENGKTEIILFLPISHMRRFTQKAIQDEETIQYIPLRQFVNSFFPENHDMIKEKVNVTEYIQHISEALKYQEQFYTTSYYIERDAVNYFALFFMSSHIFGFEKILEVKWQLDENDGRGFKIPQSIGLFDKFFAEEDKNKNAEKLESILKRILNKPKTNRQIYEVTLKNEFLPKHTTEIFEKWQQENIKFKVLDLKTQEAARKKSFYISWKYYKEDKVKFILE